MTAMSVFFPLDTARIRLQGERESEREREWKENTKDVRESEN